MAAATLTSILAKFTDLSHDLCIMHRSLKREFNMQLFFEFLTQQWTLAAAWVVLVIKLIRHENSKGGKSLSPQKLSDYVNQQQAIVLDVRDNSEFRQGHIVNAISAPFREIDNHIKQLQDKKSTPIIVVCKMGQTAGAVTKQLKAQGFEHVFKLGGGLSEWKIANFPLVKGD